MIKKSLTNIAAIIIWLVPIFYFLHIYSNLPQTVALHFDINGNPNRYGNKDELIGVQILLSVITITVYFLIHYLPKIDPKKTVSYSAETFKKVSFLLVIFLSAIQLITINSSITGRFTLNKFLLPILGLFFAYLGNLMHSIKPNYFFGIRTPWTLEDPETWRATHQLGGKLWFIGGITITIITLILPTKIAFPIFIGIIITMSLIPVAYSYLYFKKHNQ
jgi:uncharacterized membrane protein